MTELWPTANWQQDELMDKAKSFDIPKRDIQKSCEEYKLLVMKSRMMGDYHVRFCEGLGVRFPRSTRLNLTVPVVMVCSIASLGTNHAKPFELELQVMQMFCLRFWCKEEKV